MKCCYTVTCFSNCHEYFRWPQLQRYNLDKYMSFTLLDKGVYACEFLCVHVYSVFVCVCVCLCVRACVRECVRPCVRACVRACVHL